MGRQLLIREVHNHLSDERRKVYDFIRGYSLENGGNVPSLRDIAHYMGTWVSSAHYHVNVLKSFGLLAESNNTNGYCLVGARFSVDFSDPVRPSVGPERGHNIIDTHTGEDSDDPTGDGGRKRRRGKPVREADDIRWFRQNYMVGQ